MGAVAKKIRERNDWRVARKGDDLTDILLYICFETTTDRK